MKDTVEFVGHISTQYRTLDECPGQARPENGTSQIIVDRDYQPALLGLEAGGYIQVLYWFDKADRQLLRAIPPWAKNNEQRGVFSLRSPSRPNPIALSTVEIIAIEDNILTVTALDCVDGTPLLDIKPFINQIRVKVP